MDVNLTGQIWGMPVSLIGQLAQASNIGSTPTNLTIVNQIHPTNAWIVAAIGLLGAIIGAVTAGCMKYAMERKNTLLQAYSQLTGRKFALIQGYADVLRISLNVYYNIGLQKECEKAAKLNEELDKEKQKFYLDQKKKFEDGNEYNVVKFEKKGNNLIRIQENFWRTIALINGITSNKKVDGLIEDIRIGEISLMSFQQEMIKETINGLPDYTRDGSEFLSSKWHEKKSPLLELYIKQFNDKIDLLINYIRENETNKHWLNFLR